MHSTPKSKFLGANENPTLLIGRLIRPCRIRYHSSLPHTVTAHVTYNSLSSILLGATTHCQYGLLTPWPFNSMHWCDWQTRKHH